MQFGSVREFISVLLDDKDFEAMARTLTELDQRRVPPVTIEH